MGRKNKPAKKRTQTPKRHRSLKEYNERVFRANLDTSPGRWM